VKILSSAQSSEFTYLAKYLNKSLQLHLDSTLTVTVMQLDRVRITGTCNTAITTDINFKYTVAVGNIPGNSQKISFFLRYGLD